MEQVTNFYQEELDSSVAERDWHVFLIHIQVHFIEVCQLFAGLSARDALTQTSELTVGRSYVKCE